MKNCRTAVAALAVAALVCASCAPHATVSGTIAGASSDTLSVQTYGTRGMEAIDTVVTAADGSFSFKVAVQKGDPEFVYVYNGTRRVASLLLEEGEQVTVEADSTGSWTVAGSEGSELLCGVENDFAGFVQRFYSAATPAEMSHEYVAYYRDRVKFVMGHPYSLTVVQVLNQNLGEGAPIFSQTTDAIHFRRAVDSLKTVYPDSRYVKALDKEASRREQILGLERTISQAEEAGFPDIKLPDMNGEKVSLAGVRAKAVLLHFWSSADGAQSMFNLDVLKPIYDEFHSKGFEIYAVSVDTDKPAWATVVRNQKLDWINVNDGLGASSPAVRLYNVQSLPTSILIVDGDISSARIDGKDGLRRELRKALK